METLFERILLLKQGMAFTHVPTESLRIVAAELVPEFFPAGDLVFRKYDQGEQMYIIQQGSIGISIEDHPRGDQFIALLSPGDCFGEMGMLDDQPRSASAHVIEDSQLLILEKGRLIALLSRYPELALGILRSLSLRLRESNARLDALRQDP